MSESLNRCRLPFFTFLHRWAPASRIESQILRSLPPPSHHLKYISSSDASACTRKFPFDIKYEVTSSSCEYVLHCILKLCYLCPFFSTLSPLSERYRSLLVSTGFGAVMVKLPSAASTPSYLLCEKDCQDSAHLLMACYV